MREVCSNEHHWTALEDNYFTPLLPSAAMVTDSLAAAFMHYGVCARLSFFWGLDPFPISPFFLVMVMGNLSQAMSPKFIEAVAPRIAKRLATWQPDKIGDQLILKNTEDPMLLINQCDLKLDVGTSPC
jgi:hypothetical protein